MKILILAVLLFVSLGSIAQSDRSVPKDRKQRKEKTPTVHRWFNSLSRWDTAYIVCVDSTGKEINVNVIVEYATSELTGKQSRIVTYTDENFVEVDAMKIYFRRIRTKPKN